MRHSPKLNPTNGPPSRRSPWENGGWRWWSLGVWVWTFEHPILKQKQQQNTTFLTTFRPTSSTNDLELLPCWHHHLHFFAIEKSSTGKQRNLVFSLWKGFQTWWEQDFPNAPNFHKSPHHLAGLQKHALKPSHPFAQPGMQTMMPSEFNCFYFCPGFLTYVKKSQFYWGIKLIPPEK